MLYLVATPIGNLADITLRALDVLKSSDYILCEDTRHSLHLLKHYGIQKPLKSFHKFNEATKEEAIIQDIQEGKIVSLISDAGTPGIADPGMRLVQSCIQENLPVTPIPGVSAPITALCCSGLSTEVFQFVGFLPKAPSELKKYLKEVLNYRGTTLCFESPQRLTKTLALLNEIDPERKIAVARELTKQYEEVVRGTASELLEIFGKTSPKGEIVLLFSGKEKQEFDFSALTPTDHVLFIQNEYGVTRKEAIKIVAELRHVPKRVIYQEVENSGS